MITSCCSCNQPQSGQYSISLFLPFEYILYIFAAPTNPSLVILSGASLEVKWEPAPDADQNPLTYTVTAEGVNAETK